MPNLLMGRRQLLRTAIQLSAVTACAGINISALAAPANAATLQTFIDDLVAKRAVPGAIAAIGEAGGAPKFLHVGKLAFDSTTDVDADTLWRVYSQTKPITGMAAMMLIEAGKLKLDQPVADVIPAFASLRVLADPEHSLDARPAKQTMTIRHLLTHTAGLGYTSELNKDLLTDEYRRNGLSAGRTSRAEATAPGAVPTAPSLAAFAERLATMPLLAEPGSKWSYSCSLDLLGRIIEIVAGQPFDTFLQQRIFMPLGMHSTYFEVPDSDRNRLATNYRLEGKTLTVIDPGPTSIYLEPPAFPFGGSGLVSSARDYDRFLAMLANRGTLDGVTLLSPATAALAMSNLLPAGADLSQLKMLGIVDSGFGAGGSVQLSGPGKGTFGWGGAAGSAGVANPISKRRASGFINVMGQYALLTEVPKTIA